MATATPNKRPRTPGEIGRPPSPGSGARSGRVAKRRRLVDSLAKLSLTGPEAASLLQAASGGSGSAAAPAWLSSSSGSALSDDDGDMVLQDDSDDDDDDDDEGLDADHGSRRLVFIPDIEKKLNDIPYALLRGDSGGQGYSHTVSLLSAATRDGLDLGFSPRAKLEVPRALRPRDAETGLVLYRPAESVIGESLAKHRARADEEHWGDDEMDGYDTMELD
ncbi:uncharacterized protein V1510DRAFT_412433 [Dipodascopsis tothii]|uniref:uncharacterized protein n=1 Tax=Dipodascopsis tothii TaxID=44089 RepID=UPI0034CFE6D9